MNWCFYLDKELEGVEEVSWASTRFEAKRLLIFIVQSVFAYLPPNGPDNSNGFGRSQLQQNVSLYMCDGCLAASCALASRLAEPTTGRLANRKLVARQSRTGDR